MDVKIVLDISSIVWDENDYNANETSYYTLRSEVYLFIQAFEKCNNLKLLVRKELFDNIKLLFPYKLCTEHNMFDFQRMVLQFLSAIKNVSYNEINTGIYAVPNICYDYFSPDLKTEIGYLITEIHNNSEKHIFCTFGTRWQSDNCLKTHNGNKKEYYTIVHKESSATIQEYYLNNVRNVFEHNEKHDSNKGTRKENNEWVYPLSCYDEREKDTTIPQQLLESATPFGNDFYNYDDVNQTFVHFKNHLNNKYHGYDEDINNVPQKIKAEFYK
jgi:hypothetical protein